MREVPEKFDWVKARHECSLSSQFIELRLEAERNVEAVKTLVSRSSGGRLRFEYKPVDDSTFVIVRYISEDTPFERTAFVRFRRKDDRITVETDTETLLFEIRHGLNDFGQCILKIDSEGFFKWQVLRKALEKLFFDIPG
jgi:hypothetical protein